MIIKSDCKCAEAVWLLLFCSIVSAVLTYVTTNNMIYSTIAASLMISITVRLWISTCRTIEFQADSVTITIWKFSKSYSWTDFKIKRYVDYHNAYGYKNPYTNGAEFSLKSISRPRWLKPTEYSVIAHPLSYVYVNFLPDQLSKADLMYPLVYPVDEKSFRMKLELWDIQMEQIK